MDLQQKKIELQGKISVLETQLTELKAKLHKVEELEQHQAIEELDVHLNDFDSLLNNIITFTQICRDELSKKKP